MVVGQKAVKVADAEEDMVVVCGNMLKLLTMVHGAVKKLLCIENMKGTVQGGKTGATVMMIMIQTGNALNNNMHNSLLAVML